MKLLSWCSWSGLVSEGGGVDEVVELVQLEWFGE